MFGIIYSLFMTMGVVGHNVKNLSNDIVEKDKQNKKGKETYIDSLGRQRLIADDRHVITTERDGDKVLIDAKTRKIIKNYTNESEQKKREIAKNEAIKNNKTVYLYKSFDKNDKWAGDWYQDIKTNQIYVVRKFTYGSYPFSHKEIYFYIDIHTGDIVRKTDWQIEMDQHFINKIDDLPNKVKEIVYNIHKNDNLTEEEIKNIINETYEEMKKALEKKYLNDSETKEFIIEQNKIRKELKETNPSVYYGFKVYGRA